MPMTTPASPAAMPPKSAVVIRCGASGVQDNILHTAARKVESYHDLARRRLPSEHRSFQTSLSKERSVLFLGVGTWEGSLGFCHYPAQTLGHSPTRTSPGHPNPSLLQMPVCSGCCNTVFHSCDPNAVTMRLTTSILMLPFGK